MALATVGLVRENKLLMPSNLSTGYLHVNPFTFYLCHTLLYKRSSICDVGSSRDNYVHDMYIIWKLSETWTLFMFRYDFEVCGSPTVQMIGQWSTLEQFARGLALVKRPPFSWGLALMWVVIFYFHFLFGKYLQCHQGWIISFIQQI